MGRLSTEGSSVFPRRNALRIESMERWQGRVALVTGASVGIGAGICKELVKHGIKVIGCARDVQKIPALAEGLPKGSLTGIKCDLQNESEILLMFQEVKEKYGRLDICINNAGFATLSSLITGSTKDFKGMLDVNVLALCICTRESLKLMSDNNIDDGQIIHISSMAAHRSTSMPGTDFYSGTKTMVRILTEGLRKELRTLDSHIRIATVSPGIVETEFAYRMMNDRQKVDAFYSSLKPLSPDDVAACVISILQTPAHVDINDVLVRPVEQKE